MKRVRRMIYLHESDNNAKYPIFECMDNNYKYYYQFIPTLIPLSDYNQELIDCFSKFSWVRDHINDYF